MALRFDLRIMGWEGKNWRLFKTGLEKEINPDSSSIKVTKNSIYIYLAKVRRLYGRSNQFSWRFSLGLHW